MNLDTIFLAVKVLPENNWYQSIDLIVHLVLFVAPFLVIGVILYRSFRRNRYCPRCRTKTVLSSRVKEHPPGKKFTRFGSRWVYGDVKIVVLRCPKCGWEIDLGK